MENSWNQNQLQETAVQNECIVRFNSSVPTNIIFQQFEMCHHQTTDLQPGQNPQVVACNCEYISDPEVTVMGVNSLPVVKNHMPNQTLSRSEAMLYGSNMPFDQPYMASSSNPPPLIFQNAAPLDSSRPPPELNFARSAQNSLGNLSFNERWEDNSQNLRSNGLIKVKEEPIGMDEFGEETCDTNSYNPPEFPQHLCKNLIEGNEFSDKYRTSRRRSRSISGERLSRLSPIRSRRFSVERSKSPRSCYHKRSRSPRHYSPRRRSPRRYSPTRRKSPRKYSRSRSRSQKRYSPSRGRSPRNYSRSRSRSPRKISDARSTSPRKCSPRTSKSPTSCNFVNTQNKTSTDNKNQPSNPGKELEKEKNMWTRTAPADLYYKLELSNSLVVHGTEELRNLCDQFEEKLLKNPEAIRAGLPKYEPFPKRKLLSCKKHTHCHSCSSSDDSSSDSDLSDHEDLMKEELEYKKKHPLRLHEELWFNYPGEMNDGPLCRCSAKARRSGIRHNIYAGEQHISSCDPNSNNADKLYHYRITMSPPTNFLVKLPTIIEYDAHEYIFEGFSMFSHKKLGDLPQCKVIRFNIEYTIVYYEEKFPHNFTVKELNHFQKYLFHELLELVDLDFRAHGDTEGCPQYHFMPRFVRELQGNGKEILSMNEVLKYLLESYQPLVDESSIENLLSISQSEWQGFTDKIKGMIVTYPGKKPCSLRIDQLDREPEPVSTEEDSKINNKSKFPQIVHFGMRPPELSYAGNPEYQKAWREYVKFRHLLANMPKPSFEDKRKLKVKEIRLQNLRTKNELKRNVTVIISSEHFYKTGIMCDIVQHALLLPVLVSHLRFHRSLDVLEEKINYVFKNRYVLQLALTHPSYRENFGTNPDHARNSLTNCGIRQPVYGDRRIHYMNTRKRGINTLINIMSKFGKTKETESNITHNERLEFLGDAVVEFVTSVHLFHMFSDLEEGGLATYRSAIVQNQHLAVLAKKLGLEDFMLYAHGSDLCHDLELRHAMANCFEALMGALFLDGGIKTADKVFGEALYQGEPNLLEMWVDYPSHPLQEQEPLGDRKWIERFPFLKKLKTFEDSIGVKFTHVRLLARAFTDRSIGFTNLTLGSNQRLEFLGDTVLQLIASEYLYKYFPEHHEGHLSLLRSSLVNNRTQAVVCDDLGMTAYALYSNPKAELKTKDRADLLEAFLGALYVDKDLEYCEVFCSVCFFPRLQTFILHQDWNDPKSKLQQCCLTLRTMKGGEPEIPVYKVIESKGPTNTRIYTVAVYFKGKRLAAAAGHSIQQAEMNAAKKALKLSQGLFPQLDHQKRVISKSMNRQTPGYNQKHVRNSNDKTSRTENYANKSGSNNHLDHNRRSKTPPLAYRRRNSPETTEMLKKKEKKGDMTEKKKYCKSNEDLESLSASKDAIGVENIDSTKNISLISTDKQREENSVSASQGNISDKAANSNSCSENSPIDQTSLKCISDSKLYEDQSHSKFSVCKRSPTLPASKSLSCERSSRPQNYSIQNNNIPSSKRTLNKSKSRSPARHRTRRSQSKSPNRRYSPERHKFKQSRSPSKYVSSSRQKSYRQASLDKTTRSPSREEARKNLMDFMLGKRSSPGIEPNKSKRITESNHQPVSSYQFQDTRQNLPNVPASFQHFPTNVDSFAVQSLNHPCSTNIHVPPPSSSNIISNFNNHPSSHINSLPPPLQKLSPLSLKNVSYHQGPPPHNSKFPSSNNSIPELSINSKNFTSCPPPNISKPPPNKQIPPTSRPMFLSSTNHLPYPSAPPNISLPPPNGYIPPRNTNIPPLNSRIPPPNSHLPPPNSTFLPHNSHFTPTNTHLPPPKNYIPPPNSHMPPPNSHMPPLNSHMPPLNSHMPPPNSHIPPNIHLPPPPMHKSHFAGRSSSLPYPQNNFYRQ